MVKVVFTPLANNTYERYVCLKTTAVSCMRLKYLKVLEGWRTTLDQGTLVRETWDNFSTVLNQERALTKERPQNKLVGKLKKTSPCQ